MLKSRGWKRPGAVIVRAENNLAPIGAPNGRMPEAHIEYEMSHTETLESPPRSGHAATMMKLTTFAPDGSEKGQVTFNINRLVFRVGLAVLAWVFLPEGVKTLERRQHLEEAAELRPVMEKLASEGKVAASLWLVENYFDENKQRLAQLAADGNPEAMFQQGLGLLRSGDKEGGMRWLEKSAAAGYAPAIRAIQRSERDHKH